MNIVSKHISNRTLLLILVLTGFTIFFLILALRPPMPSSNTKIIPTPTPFAQSTLTLTEVPTNSTTSAINTKQFTVNIDTHINSVTVAQIEIGYDPGVVTITNIEPGTFFPHPVQLLKNIDMKNGRISYALGIQPQESGIKGKGTIATISYTILDSAKRDKTAFYVLPKTIIGAQGIALSVLKNANSLTISIPNVTPGSPITPTYYPQPNKTNIIKPSGI